MSLFASSFQDASSGPSTLSAPTLGKPHKDGNKKRKRASASFTAGGGSGANKLKITESNFHKIMKKVEGGEVKEKGGEGFNMGGRSKAEGGKEKPKVEMKGKGARNRAMANASSGASPAAKSREATEAEAKPKGDVGKKRKADEREDEDEAPRTASGKPAPAELPLPHDVTKSSRKSKLSDSSLTDMQKGMQAKLEGARFRWINEQLYSNPSTEAVAMMKKDPKIFEDTHRALTSAWPSPPLPHLITLLTPLPPKTVIVDLGCGDAGLAKALVPQGKIVMSYDLVGDSGSPGVVNPGAGGGWVVEADFLEGVPLPGRPGGLAAGASAEDEAEGEGQTLGRRGKKGKGKAKAQEASEIVDVVVCCLSLMGVNWVGGIYEASRILKEGGTFQIAEVTSRFISIPSFIAKVESFGLELKSQNAPSTHFTLFEFEKQSAVPLGPARGEEGWAARVEEGEEILRGCVYKKR